MISRQALVYLAVGVASAAIDIGLMQLLMWSGIHYLASTTIAFVAGFLANFILHARITFKADYSLGSFVRYIAVVLLNYVLTVMVVEAFHRASATALLGKVTSLPLVAVTGYFLGKHWIYKPRLRESQKA